MSAQLFPTPIDELLAAVTGFRARRVEPERSPDEMAEGLLRLRQAIDALELEFAREAAAFAGTDQHDAEGFASTISWLRHECHMTGAAASAAVCVGETPGLERSRDATLDGRIGFSHLTLLARTAGAVRQAGAAFDEPSLLRLAERRTPTQFRRDCAHARHAADAEAFLERQREETEARFLELRTVSDTGCVWVRGFLDPVGGATVRAALEPLARRCGSGDGRPADRRLADALVEISEHILDTDGGAAADGRHVPHLQVTAGLDTLLGLVHAPAAELDSGPVVAGATVQRIACAANVVRILLGPDSAVIDVGRERRLPAPATRRAVARRDHGCVWPSCDRPERWTQPHHVIHWTRGGSTAADNLVSLCARHHWMCHEGGWRVVRVDGEREVRAVPPLLPTYPLIRGPAAVCG